MHHLSCEESPRQDELYEDEALRLTMKEKFQGKTGKTFFEGDRKELVPKGI
jgi:hypothetical protein